MKTIVPPKTEPSGSALLTVLVMCTVLSFLVIGYLSVIQFQSRMSARSQSWNLAIAVAEAGIEEGLQHLNHNSGALGSDNWTFDGAHYNLTRTLANGDSYTVALDAGSDPMNPSLESRGFVLPPALAQTYQTTPYFFAAAGVNTQVQPITRAVRVRCHRGGMFLAAMVAKRIIDLKGNGVLTDSFDSSDPAKSTNGHYDPTKAGDKGDVASNLGIINAISVQNANIYGHVHTGPRGTATVGSQGAVGSHAWQDAGNKGIQPGWATDDANFTFPDTTLPYTTGSTPAPGDITTVSGYTTNATYVNGSLVYPPPPPAGSTMSPITTNTSYFTVSTYPGPKPDMTTNQAYVTVPDYPGAVAGLITNYTAFTTVSNYPGARPGLSTNTSWTTVTTYPGAKPQMSTNTTHLTNQKNPPAAGTYVPGTLVQQGNGKWTYDRINSYTYAIYTYTYATTFSYTYLAPTYTYPEFTYSYTIYQSAATYTTNHYDNVLLNGDYVATSLSGTVYAAGKARLVLPNGLSMSGNDSFILGPNGSLEVYSDGPSITVGGNGVINPSGYAGNFILYCTPNTTDFTLNGNGEFTGVLVAPEAELKLNGGGNADEDFIGCLMVNTVRMNGHFSFHYDEALGRMPANGRFLITSWDEIP
jgi:hypothetical protein